MLDLVKELLCLSLRSVEMNVMDKISKCSQFFLMQFVIHGAWMAPLSFDWIKATYRLDCK